jgi:hypothetical protein
MTPMQAIRSATVVAAQLLQAEADLGAIEPGMMPTSWPLMAIRCRTSPSWSA